PTMTASPMAFLPSCSPRSPAGLAASSSARDDLSRGSGAQQAAGNRVDPVLPEHIGHQMLPAEQSCECPIQNIQRSGQAAEGGHHQPYSIASEAGPAHGAPALDDARARMQVSGNLAL